MAKIKKGQLFYAAVEEDEGVEDVFRSLKDAAEFVDSSDHRLVILEVKQILKKKEDDVTTLNSFEEVKE